MAFWGFITALSRPVTLGFDAWPEFAMRIANGALPLILFWIYYSQQQELNEEQETAEDLHDSVKDTQYEQA